MNGQRQHRGPHPKDRELFAPAHHAALRTAVEEYSWLLGRGYAEPSALKLVGDRHNLTARQRTAVQRSACSDAALASRRRRRVALGAEPGRALGIDGHNLLITLESAISGAVVLVGRDGCCRDLASVHGTYRRVQETGRAIALVAEHVAACHVGRVDWYLDRPVSNSGLLRGLIERVVGAEPAARAQTHRVELADDPDRLLGAYQGCVASGDSWILDRCGNWASLAQEIVRAHVPAAWIVSLGPAGNDE
ncbi:MAG: DUF434 domain-containing protein [Deltaproteobacteria bacterium]|nr:DUF434 domain-containing protein [Deltaproteobacteria bacterium]